IAAFARGRPATMAMGQEAHEVVNSVEALRVGVSTSRSHDELSDALKDLLGGVPSYALIRRLFLRPWSIPRVLIFEPGLALVFSWTRFRLVAIRSLTAILERVRPEEGPAWLPAAVELLFPLIDDPDPEVSYEALHALLGIRHSRRGAQHLP